ncbi:MAG: helix-turn-helix domain-containing protein, partial [Anaerolineales bacterium]
MTDQTEWLRLTEAASRLGVHPTTLRRWADDGKIASTRTAGGHRRFAVSDLEAFQRNRSKLKVIGGLEQGLADQALTQTRREIIARNTWPSELEPADREEFRKSGRELLGLTMHYVALGTGGQGLLRQAERIARQYAVQGRRLGLSLSEMLQLLLFFRDSMM